MKKLHLLGTLAAVGVSAVQAASPARPNILFIMADDHTSQAISAYGGILKDVLPTPNIDRIAAEGVRLNHCYVTNSISVPSRACILTGQYSQTNGVYTLSDALDRNLPNVAKHLQAGGYRTGIIGKWHLVTEPAGFDFYNVLPGQGEYHNPTLTKTGDWGMGENGKNKLTQYKGHSTDIITDEALAFLGDKDKTDQPFFLMCHFKAPHRPWRPAERFKELLKDVTIPEPDNMYETYESRGQHAQTVRVGMEIMTTTDLKGVMPPAASTRDQKRAHNYQIYMKDYLRCVAGVDENVGRLLKYLDENGLTDNTVVIYTGDQGFFLGEHGWFDKRLMYEETIKMPLLIRYPQEIKPRTVNDDMVMNIDFAPLFLDYAGLPVAPEMQGESFRSNLKGATPELWRKSIYYRYWMHADREHNVCAHYGIRTERYKLIYFYGQPLGMTGTADKPLTPEWELYDMQADPKEMNNLYNAFKNDPVRKPLLNELKTELIKIKARYNDADSKYPQLETLNKTYFWE